MKRKILTLEQLVMFCKEQHFYSFNSKESGYNLSVTIPGTLNFLSDETRGLLMADVKVCHIELNRNGSYVSQSNMEKAMPTLKYRPVLAHIHQLDSGEYDFHSHDVEFVENEDGEEEMVYIEKQVGAFTADEPYLKYDEKMDKTYVHGVAAIPEDYTMAADIIRRKEGTKVSCELCIEAFSYNAKEHYLELEDFYFGGVCLLGSEKDGTEIGEGMLGSRLDIKDFSSTNNSVIQNCYSDNDKLIETLEKLNITLSKFNIDNQLKEGGTQVTMNHFEELLAKYNKTLDDITFEYSNMTDEELDAKFAEMFDEEVEETEVTTEEHSEEEIEVEETEEIEESEEVEIEEETEEEVVVVEEALHPVTYSVNMSNGVTRTFELSLSDIQSALYNLVNDTYSEADNCWYGVTVYESYVVMQDWWNDKAFKQTYKREDNNFSLTGDRVEVFHNWLTAEEEEELNNMRSNYSSISTELEKYQKAEEKAKKDNLFSAKEYSSIVQNEEVVALSKNHENYSFDELVNKLDNILLNCAKAGNFAFTNESTETEVSKPKVTHRTSLPIQTGKKKSRYGAIFSK